MDIKRTTYQTNVIENEEFHLKNLPALQFNTNGELPKISDVIKMLEWMKASYGDIEFKVDIKDDCVCGFDTIYYKPDESFTNVNPITHETYKEYFKPACLLLI